MAHLTDNNDGSRFVDYWFRQRVAGTWNSCHMDRSLRMHERLPVALDTLVDVLWYDELQPQVALSMTNLDLLRGHFVVSQTVHARSCLHGRMATPRILQTWFYGLTHFGMSHPGESEYPPLNDWGRMRYFCRAWKSNVVHAGRCPLHLDAALLCAKVAVGIVEMQPFAYGNETLARRAADFTALRLGYPLPLLYRDEAAEWQAGIDQGGNGDFGRLRNLLAKALWRNATMCEKAEGDLPQLPATGAGAEADGQTSAGNEVLNQ